MKKLLFAAFALVLAVSVSAFVSKNKSVQNQKLVTTSVWYDFIGQPGEESDINKYVQDSDQVTECPSTGNGRCEILAPPIASGPDAGKPDLSLLQDETFYP